MLTTVAACSLRRRLKHAVDCQTGRGVRRRCGGTRLAAPAGHGEHSGVRGGSRRQDGRLVSPGPLAGGWCGWHSRCQPLQDRISLLASAATLEPVEEDALEVTSSGEEELLNSLSLISNEPDTPWSLRERHAGESGQNLAIGKLGNDFALTILGWGDAPALRAAWSPGGAGDYSALSRSLASSTALSGSAGEGCLVWDIASRVAAATVSSDVGHLFDQQG